MENNDKAMITEITDITEIWSSPHFQKCLARDCKTAQILSGTLHEFGVGVERDLIVALEWYHKAAAQGMQEAQEKFERLQKKISLQ